MSHFAPTCGARWDTSKARANLSQDSGVADFLMSEVHIIQKTMIIGNNEQTKTAF